jgi:hypothetical protein
MLIDQWNCRGKNYFQNVPAADRVPARSDCRRRRCYTDLKILIMRIYLWNEKDNNTNITKFTMVEIYFDRPNIVTELVTTTKKNISAFLRRGSHEPGAPLHV